ncbi:hypothetical protein B0H14DRAFT_1617507 [Mycena olivaceomarginata]|nr:hypothetical protein B0H14DRAFT_1617507 [Mycena olivaceomarginata]
MVFLNELIPFRHFLNRFEYSRILASYILAYCTSEWREAINCWRSVSLIHEKVDHLSFPVWIRPATGELCVDLVEDLETSAFPFGHVWIPVNVPRLENVSLNDSDPEAVLLSNLDDDKWHDLFLVPLSARARSFSVSTELSFRLGPTIFRWNTQLRTLVPVTEPLCLGCDVDYDLRWLDRRRQERKQKLMANSWMRYYSSRVRDLCLAVCVGFQHRTEAHKSWLAQLNHIFAQLETTSHSEDYICATVEFTLRCFPNTYNNQKPKGYLFVCPSEDFRVGPVSLRWPVCPAYWSFDRSGATRLSTEDARTFGFPMIHIETTMYGFSWNKAVYDELRLSHHSRGFNVQPRHPRHREISRLSSDACISTR